MPEGDSVLRVARDFRHPRWATVRLDGRRVETTVSVGKHLLTRVEGGVTVHTHLRMDGDWTVIAPGRRLPRRLHPDVRVEFATRGPDGASGPTALALRMPVVEVLATADEASVVGHLGPDVLAGAWQPVVAAERLLRDPARAEGGAARPAQRRRSRFSVSEAGAPQVTTGDTRRGRTHWVSGRTGCPCLRCGTPARVVAEVPGDPERRRTWWCPSCQPGPSPVS